MHLDQMICFQIDVCESHKIPIYESIDPGRFPQPKMLNSKIK